MFKPKNLMKTAMKGAIGVRCTASGPTREDASMASKNTRGESSLQCQSDNFDFKSSQVEKIEVTELHEAEPLVTFSSEMSTPCSQLGAAQQLPLTRTIGMTSNYKYPVGVQDLLS